MTETQRWEHFPHGADVGIRGIGPTAAAAFEQVARAMTAAVADVRNVEPRERVDVACKPTASLDDLLFDWIDALVFEMSTRGMLFSRFEVRLDDRGLRAAVWGEPIDPSRHEPAVEIKGPTYTELRVTRDDASSDWIAQCVVDV